jgi:hypothetical protein
MKEAASSSSIGSEEGKKSRLNGGKFEAERRGRGIERIVSPRRGENIRLRAANGKLLQLGNASSVTGDMWVGKRFDEGGGGGDIQKEAGSIRLS